MISKSEIKQIKALELKKNRKESGLFVAEGHKTVIELIKSKAEIRKLFVRENWVGNIPNKLDHLIVSEREMKQISFLNTVSDVLAVVSIPGNIVPLTLPHPVNLFLDDIRDPGNFGTIARIADWYGLTTIFCSEDCVDYYNPKTVQATMGSVARVKAVYTNLKLLMSHFQITVYAAVLENAISIHEIVDTGNCMIIIGNEGHGVSKNILESDIKRIFIPGYGGAESLNAAVASGIILDNLIRLRLLQQ
jgi:TrmH family RNA methyltransferase